MSVDALLARLRAFHFPEGEEAGRRIRGLRTTQRGDIRAAAAGKWLPLLAEETVDATRSQFRWEARMGKGLLQSMTIVDAYEDGKGLLIARKGPLVLKRGTGPDFDRGEIQRYLSLPAYCPSILLLHPDLVWEALAADSLRVRDRRDATGATVDLVLGADGAVAEFRADRPMAAGSATVLTPWTARPLSLGIHDGVRIATRLEAAWQPPSGGFTYVRIELDRVEAIP